MSDWLGKIGSGAVAFFTALCPACIALTGAIFSALGLGFLTDMAVLKPLTAVLLLLALLSLARSAYRLGRYWPLALATFGGVFAYAGRYILIPVNDLMTYFGAALLLGGLLWNARLKRQQKICTVCHVPDSTVTVAPVQRSKLRYNLTILVALLLLANQILLGGVLGSQVANATLILPANADEAAIIQAVVPPTGLTRPYTYREQPITLSARTPGNGYDLLVAMERDIDSASLSADAQTRYRTLIGSVYHACCNAPIDSCNCKHAVAARGLIKFLLAQGWTDTQITDEVFLWQRYWWPQHYATAALYLQSQGIDPAQVSSADWLSSQISTASAGRTMRAALTQAQ